MIASLIIALHLMGFVTLDSAVSSLYIAGALLIIAELGIVSFGLIAFNGVIAIYAAHALQTGHDLIFGAPIAIPTLFGIAFIEFSLIAIVIYIHIWLRKRKVATGVQSMIGEQATIIEWDGRNGMANYEGEIWKVKSNDILDLSENDKVSIKSVNKLEITITK